MFRSTVDSEAQIATEASQAITDDPQDTTQEPSRLASAAVRNFRLLAPTMTAIAGLIIYAKDPVMDILKVRGQ